MQKARAFFCVCAGLLCLALAAPFAATAAEPPPAYLGEWGTLGTGPGQFDHPFGVAVDNGGFVYVTDE